MIARRRTRAAAVLAAAMALAFAVAGVQAAQEEAPAQQLATGKRLFTKDATPPCAVCHTLKDAGTEGAVGPVLDELKPDAARVAAAVRNGIGIMPPYKASLSEAQIQALARYVATAAGAR